MQVPDHRVCGEATPWLGIDLAGREDTSDIHRIDSHLDHTVANRRYEVVAKPPGAG